MPTSILFLPELYVILFRIDSELAETARKQGCSCGGPLHAGHYRRKPRALVDLDDEHSLRLSWCCGHCRRRTTPPSVRFLGRRVYSFPVVVLVTALSVGASRSRIAVLRDELGIDRRTLERWRKWWREEFPETRFWRAAGARFMPPIAGPHPRSLLDRFVSGLDGLIQLLRFLNPLSLPTPAS